MYLCSVALPHGAVGWSQCVIVVFPDHTHLHFVGILLIFNGVMISVVY